MYSRITTHLVIEKLNVLKTTAKLSVKIQLEFTTFSLVEVVLLINFW